MNQPKKLIEVAMPVKEVSAECVRDDRIQHGHISSLHKWWARRPLPVCRSVVFASLIPDPLDENCPQAFSDAVEDLLGIRNNVKDPYKPYDDIPFTSAIDLMEDNNRNRLLMFIGKFSPTYCLNEKSGKKTEAKDQISDDSLIKWENKNNEKIINIARLLIWVAHNSFTGKDFNELKKQFNDHLKEIRNAEVELCNLIDRHVDTVLSKPIEQKLQKAIDAFLNKMPKVFDPFAGGGAIPLEASRLGCRTYGNDINPVAHIIQKASLEFPQKFGKKIIYSKDEFIKIYGKNSFNELPNEHKEFKNGEAISAIILNQLAFDVRFYAKKALSISEKEIGTFYPTDKSGNSPRVYYWLRVGICMNPTCKAHVPLLKQFYVCNKIGKQVYLKPVIEGTEISFEIKYGKCDLEGWIKRGNLVCPCCNNVTTSDTLKSQFIDGVSYDTLGCVINDGVKGKEYALPSKADIDIVKKIPKSYRPIEKLPVKYTKAMAFCLWGFEEWGQLFSDRQLLAINSLVKSCTELQFHEADLDYINAIKTYLAIWVDRMAARLTKFGIIDLGGEKVVDLFGLQAIQMVFDYPEINLFKLEQISWIEKYIQSESNYPFITNLSNSSSGEKLQFKEKHITTVVTDPPYYDAVAYADLSDFFYIWLKKSLGSTYPLIFSTPQTPKVEECTALKHHHNGNEKAAKKHFENKLSQIFEAIEHQTYDSISIMFAHQTTEAWSTLCNSILNAKMNITGSWAIGTEKKGGLKENKAFLSSSVTVSCKPSTKFGKGIYKDVKKAIENRVAKEVNELYRLGFRGADLLTACFGQAVSEFGKYDKVEKSDGSEVTVAELLKMARESAFNTLLRGFEGDDFTKFYIGWLQLYGFAESDFDDAAKLSRVGLTINVSDLFIENVLIKNGNKQTLGTSEERVSANRNLGEKGDSFLIDQVHKAMMLFKGTNRNALLQYVAKKASSSETSFWRVVTSLCEILPQGSEEHKQAFGLLTNRDSLIRESKSAELPKVEQTALFNQ